MYDFNPFRGKPTCRPRVKSIPPTYMSPKIKGYTDIYVILTYTGSETDVSFGLFIPEIHFFGQRLKFYSPLKGLIYIIMDNRCWTLFFLNTKPSVTQSHTVYETSCSLVPYPSGHHNSNFCNIYFSEKMQHFCFMCSYLFCRVGCLQKITYS